jgi:ankyrin repeat protein
MTDLDESHQLDPPTIVADYFSKKGGRDNSPKAILMHILYQIRQNSEASFDSAAGQLFSSFTQQRDLEFYWSLFTKIRKSLKANCYYILDGFDECIRQHRSERQSARDDVMVDFLRRLCAISKETLSGDENWTTKILLTTRPEPEVEVALVGQTVLKVPIALSDLSPGVKIVVTKEVATLAENRDVSPEVQEFIVGEVIKRCGSLFQMALTAVQFLQEPYCFDLNDREMVKAALQGLKFDKYNNIYTQVLERIHPQDREMAAKIIRILFFIRLEYPALDILQHALTMDKVDPTAEDLASPTSKGSISNLIRVSLGMLISLQDDETVDLQHPVIFDFLRTLSPTNLKAYSCEDNQEGNLYLSLICIRYLTLWRHQPLSEEEIVAAGGDEEVAAARKSPLLEYACRCWSSHTRDAGKLIKPHMNMVNKFLGITIPELLDPEDLTDYLYMVNNSRITEQSAKKETIETCPPIMFLATQNMEYVLSRYIQLQTKGRWPPAWIPRRQSRAAFGFGLDSQDETGATALHYACRGGFVGVCALLLRAGAQGSLRTVDGYTPFAYAVENGHEYMAELLIQKNQAFDGGDSEKGLSCIHFAAVQGMMGVLKFLLKRGTDPNCRSSVGWTPVHLAAQEGEINCIKLILKAGGRPDSANSIGVTPLHCAALHGRLDVLQLLFHLYPALYPSPRTVAGSDVPGSTPLNSAARLGQLECFKFLSLREHQMIPDEDGYLPIHTASAWGNKSIVNQFHELSQLNAQENNGRQPLHLAALNGHPGIFAYLKNQGAEAQPDHNGYLPIHLAAAGGYLSIVKLCPVEDDINAITKQEALPIHLAVLGGNLETFRWLRSHGSKNAPDNTGQLPLHYACSQGHNAIVREYQDSPDIHSATNDGWLPIHLAAFDGHIEAIKALLDLGAQLDAKSENISVGGGGIKAFPTTALGIAAQMEQEDLAIYLIGCGADIKISGPAGQGLVHYAAFNGLNGLFQLLVQMGQDVWLGDEDNDTPLHFAALGGKNEIVQAYIDLTRGSSISLDVGNLLGATPLMLALSAGHLETVELLLSAGATLNQRAQDGTCLSYAMIHPDEEFLRKHFGHGTEVDATDSIEGATALHFAIEQKHLGACKHLISLGANLNIQSKNGLTPLSYAAIKSSSEIVQLLLNSGSDTTLEDIFGRTAFDYAEKNPAIFKLMEPYLNNRPARSTSELNEKAKLCVQKILSSLPDVSPLNPGAEKLQYSSALENLGWGLLLLKDYDNARSCLEIRIFGSPYIERTLDCICSLCEKADEWTSFWMCKQCPSLSGMCPSCYEARSEVKIMSWCSMGHEFMEIGGEEWARLAPGYVNKEGKTIDHFIAELKQKYRVNVDSQDEIQNGTGRGLA